METLRASQRPRAWDAPSSTSGAPLRDAPGGQIGDICNAVLKLREQCAADGDWLRHALAAEVRDALGLLWACL